MLSLLIIATGAIVGCLMTTDAHAATHHKKPSPPKKYLFSAGYKLTTNSCSNAEPDTFTPLISITKYSNNSITASVPGIGKLQGGFRSRKYSASASGRVQNVLVNVGLTIKMGNAKRGTSRITLNFTSGGSSCLVQYDGIASL